MKKIIAILLTLGSFSSFAGNIGCQLSDVNTMPRTQCFGVNETAEVDSIFGSVSLHKAGKNHESIINHSKHYLKISKDGVTKYISFDKDIQILHEVEGVSTEASLNCSKRY